MYSQIFELICQYVYGNPETLTSYQELVCTQVSTFMCLICIFLPFFAMILAFRWFFK